jgi:SAM-dependent methyltransferase
VTAIEPNREMRRAAAPHRLVRWRSGTAERTGLPEASVDLVLSAQAFHWFRPRAALAEFHRVLRPGGRLALLWNQRDDRDPFTAALGSLVRAAARNHPAYRRSTTPAALLRSPLFRAVRRLEFPHCQVLDLKGLIGRTRSVSYLPRTGRRSDALEDGLRALAARSADRSGRVRLVYRTILFLARSAPARRARRR